MSERPDTKYMMQWCGKWRPVTHMYDASNVPTTLALRAAKCILWCDEPPDYGYVATRCYPGEIVERMDRAPGAGNWTEV